MNILKIVNAEEVCINSKLQNSMVFLLKCKKVTLKYKLIFVKLPTLKIKLFLHYLKKFIEKKHIEESGKFQQNASEKRKQNDYNI